jgi:hypothetical protein
VVDMVREWLMQVVVPGLGAALLVALVAFVREYAKQMKDERVRKVLELLVQAAEQLYGAGKGEAKRRFVREKMKQNGLQDLGREALEAAVYKLKTEG